MIDKILNYIEATLYLFGSIFCGFITSFTIINFPSKINNYQFGFLIFMWTSLLIIGCIFIEYALELIRENKTKEV